MRQFHIDITICRKWCFKIIYIAVSTDISAVCRAGNSRICCIVSIIALVLPGTARLKGSFDHIVSAVICILTCHFNIIFTCWQSQFDGIRGFIFRFTGHFVDRIAGSITDCNCINSLILPSCNFRMLQIDHDISVFCCLKTIIIRITDTIQTSVNCLAWCHCVCCIYIIIALALPVVCIRPGCLQLVRLSICSLNCQWTWRIHILDSWYFQIIGSGVKSKINRLGFLLVFFTRHCIHRISGSITDCHAVNICWKPAAHFIVL